eukprot:CAMPEP_0197080244 /NCGR_PEP_ID=MMETSP1384-20130603/214031_1 /TAXON_ID=29189 /ORGANISM="Ammonia sp." /LENGTH=633 /DNA_ID=CAMNT_0042519127 /DNA_START=12 /DNA_END=1911 /DNA_ORIENTATION=-
MDTKSTKSPSNGHKTSRSMVVNFSPSDSLQRSRRSVPNGRMPIAQKAKPLPAAPNPSVRSSITKNNDQSTPKANAAASTVNTAQIKEEIAAAPLVRNIARKPKYHVRNTTEDVGRFIEHLDATMGVQNFARYVAMSDGNANKVEQVYSAYKKKTMSGDALKQIEMEEEQMRVEEEQKQKQQQEEEYLSLKRKRSRPHTPVRYKKSTQIFEPQTGNRKATEYEEEEYEYEEEEEYEYEYVEIEEGCPIIIDTAVDEYVEIEEGCPIIIDNGSGYIKAGFEMSDVPILMSNQCIQSKGNQKHMLFGDDCNIKNETMQDIGDIIFPVQRDKISDWNAMNAIWRYVIESKVGVERDHIHEYPIMITETPGIEQKLREKQLQHFMEEYRLQKFYMMNTALANFYYTGKSRDDYMNTALANFYYTGKSRDDYCVIVDCGHEMTNISCIYMGMYLPQYAQRIECAGKDITNYLSTLMRHSSMYFHLDTGFRIANKIKHEHCYVAREWMHAKNNLIKKHYTLPDGRSLQIADEMYEAPEIIFCPTDPKHTKRKGPRAKSSKKSLHSILINCVNKIDDDDVEKSMYANIYCCGGSVKLPNFTNRLQSELTHSLARRMSIVSPQHIRKGVVVNAVNEPHLSAW